MLIDNALVHGRGDVEIVVRAVAGAFAVDVRDEGCLNASVSEIQLFARHQGRDHGIGLDLARSIAQAEGGRLVIGRHDPTTFSVVLLRRGQNEGGS